MAQPTFDFTDNRRQFFDYDGGEQVVYLGRANANSKVSETVWQIRKFTYDGIKVTQINFADQSTGFDKEWDERTSYDYTPD
jgi:hypothetical protein